ncbi:hypothetical protein AVEN_253515-1 [Araneus ventricosus]|uniref:Secreted protein n=1 Tax=Araneus ventricosus TaxID=182803 RepID=A0A4Y2BSJ4_ARAVE|nr:hypothetical protein AVEN_253515-1 [Araneus ventricosus]
MSARCHCIGLFLFLRGTICPSLRLGCLHFEAHSGTPGSTCSKICLSGPVQGVTLKTKRQQQYFSQERIIMRIQTKTVQKLRDESQLDQLRGDIVV